MMKNIQEKRIENELAMIKNLSIKTLIKKINKEEYYITVTIPNNMIDHIEMGDDVNVVIHIGNNFPLNAPKVYVKTAVIIINKDCFILCSFASLIYAMDVIY